MGRSRPISRRAVVLGWAALLAAPLLSAVALAAFDLRSVAGDLNRARTLLELASDQVDAGELGPASESLDQAYGLIRDSNTSLHRSIALDAVSWVPVVRENKASLDDSVAAALVLVDSGRSILRAAQPLADDDGNFEVPLRSGAIPVDAVRSVEDELRAAALALPRGPDPNSRWLLGPVDELRRDVADESRRRAEQFDAVSRALRVLLELSGDDGDRVVLIAVANTAEMRGSGGMILNYGVLRSSEGDFELGEFGRIDELALPTPIPESAAPLPADYLKRWSGFDVTNRWRNANMSADLPLVAPQLLTMYQAATGEAAQGVIQVDPAGLAAILEATGPVTHPELGVVDGSNVVDITLNQAYVQFPDIDERSDVLGDIAEAAFDRLVNGEYPSLRGLGDALFEAALQRHVAYYSSSPPIEDLVQRFDAAASIPEPGAEFFHLGVQNISANKLDYLVDTALTLGGQRPADGIGRVTAGISVANQAPVGAVTPRYVYGPFDERQIAGVYRGIVTLYLPQGASLDAVRESVGLTSQPVVQVEGGHTVVSYSVEVGPSATSTVELDLRLPPGVPDQYELLYVPSPRVRPTVVTVGLDVEGGRVEGSLPVEVPTIFRPGAEPARRGVR